MWEALHCESSLLLVAHSTSLSPLQSRNYCTVNSFPESIISCAVSLLFCRRRRAEAPLWIVYWYWEFPHRQQQRRSCACACATGTGAQRLKAAINKGFGAEGEQTLCDILKNWHWPKCLFVRRSEEEAATTEGSIADSFPWTFSLDVQLYFQVTDSIWTTIGRVPRCCSVQYPKFSFFFIYLYDS